MTRIVVQLLWICSFGFKIIELITVGPYINQFTFCPSIVIFGLDLSILHDSSSKYNLVIIYLCSMDSLQFVYAR